MKIKIDESPKETPITFTAREFTKGDVVKDHDDELLLVVELQDGGLRFASLGYPDAADSGATGHFYDDGFEVEGCDLYDVTLTAKRK